MYNESTLIASIIIMYNIRSRGRALNPPKGFTLIELLVVIAIIGILSAVVLASLNTARSKGQDAAIQSDLSTVRTQAEIYYGGDGSSSYGVEATDCTMGMFVADATIARAIEAADDTNGLAGAVACNTATDGTAYAVAAQLVSSTAYWCVDSVGNAKQVTTALGAGTVCPAS